MRVKCLAQEHNTMTQPGLEPGPLEAESSVLATESPTELQGIIKRVKLMNLNKKNYNKTCTFVTIKSNLVSYLAKFINRKRITSLVNANSHNR